MNKGVEELGSNYPKHIFKQCLVKKKRANCYIHSIVLGLSSLIVCVYI